MKVTVSNYEQLRAWFARILPQAIAMDFVNDETDPVKGLDRVAARSPAMARKSLTIGIGDMIEATDWWPADRVAAFDQELERDGLPTLSLLRREFSRKIGRILKRGMIRNEEEYFAIRNVFEATEEGDPALGRLLAEYELSFAQKS